MSLGDTSVTADKIRQMEAALDEAWARVVQELPTMALLGGTGGRSRDTLAPAISEAASNGVTDTAEMVEFALRALPGFRRSSKLSPASDRDPTV